MNKSLKVLNDLVNDLRANSSTNEKAEIIRSYVSVDNTSFLKKAFLYTYHPTWQYFVTSDNLKKYASLRGNTYSDLFDLLDALKSRTITGHEAIGSVNSFVEQYNEYEDLIHCIIDKDLKTRAGDKIINKAVPNLIPEFSVALAEKYEPDIVDWNDGWFVSRKLDGARCLAIVDSSGDVTFFSRSGNTFDTLSKVSEEIKKLGLKDVVFDGELCLIDKNGNEDFQGVMKELRKKNHTIQTPSYKIFDMVSHEEFYSKKGQSNKPYSIRLANLSEVIEDNSSCLGLLPQERIKHDDHFAEWIVKASANGWEGLILRADEPYKGKRSKDLLKYKSFFDDEYKVVDVEMGPFRYVNSGSECEETMLSCVMIEHKGHIVRVGSGFSIDQRKEFYQDPKKILNKEITVQYFQETQNQEGGISLRFPTFKILHGNKRSI
jgi:DNA ligase-1